MNVASLEIRRITLYKHGLAYIERAGSFEGDQFDMTFPTEAMDDVLKSLVIVDDAGGVVHGVDVERAEDRLATIQATDDSLNAEYATIESDINTRLDALSSPGAT
jgi:hypothetical protein